MARGTEDPNAEGWGETRRPLIHFDLKPENIFLGTKDREEHVVMPIFKVGDLGLMEESESATAVYSTEYFQNHIMLGTPCILAPEQTRLSHLVVTNRSGVENRIPNVQLEKRYRRFGSLTNVYQVGAAIWCLATLSGWFDVWGRTYISQLSANLMKGDTIGEDLERGIFNPSIIRRYRFSGIDGREDQTRYQVPYSNALKTLVLECLMQRPAHRPSAEELLARATVGYSLAREACKDAEGTDADDFVTTEPTSRVATPAHWRQMDRLDEWPLAPQDADFDSLFSMAIFKPLDEVLDRRLRHLKRYIQVWDARTFVGGYDLDVATALKIVEAKTKAKRQERYLRRMRHEPRPLVVAVVAVTLCAHLSGPPQRKQLRWARHKTVASLKINAKLHWLDLCEVPDMRIADADALPGTPSYDWDDACTMMDLGPGGPDDKGELTKELHVWMRDGAGFRFPPMYSTPSPSPPRPPPPPETTAEARAEPNEPAEKLGAQTSARVDPATNDDAATAAAAASTPRAEGIPRKRRRDGSVLTEGSPQAKKKKKKRDEV
ncbi:MAG: hypothetical protein M1818_005652 [Claussenomyces sp. TS43310]|nr:MAG: hypothetical protein M1818_005652 [Claussenomyces sp. TS43310]